MATKKKITKPATVIVRQGKLSTMIDLAILALLVFATSTLILASIQLCQKITITITK